AQENNEDIKLKSRREGCEEPLAPIVDKVKLGEPGYKERYYSEKFGLSNPKDIDRVRKDTVLKYVEGLCWVCWYYYQGVCSWLWYYPYHYAPFASDFIDLVDLEITFFPGEPFKPFDQLMGTLPAASASALPEKYRSLMTDPLSPISEFYPSDFEIDMNGKRFAWQGVAKLPFIDEKKLLAETRKLEDTLTVEEQVRNSEMGNLLYVHSLHPLAAQISFCYHHYDRMPPNQNLLWPIKPSASGGMNGFLWLCGRNGQRMVIPSPISGLQDIRANRILNVTFVNPPLHNHIPQPPDGVVMPKKVLRPSDIKPFPLLWHEDNGGRRHQGRDRRQVPGAISGPMLGEAAHRLLKNTLNIKTSQTSYRLVEQTSRNAQGNHVINRTRPAGSSGYEKSFCEDQSYLCGYDNPRGIMRSPRFAISPYELQSNRQNFKAQDRYLHQEQHHKLRNGMSALTLESGVRTRPHAALSPRMPNSGPLPNMNHQFDQNIRTPPPPPSEWINKPAAAYNGIYFRQVETSSAVGNEKQVKMVYQVKSRSPNLSHPEPQG
ncbi:unnamed protein product, partial [Ilex paraguariensis]